MYAPNWLGLTPKAVPLGTARPKDSVYHFLVPDSAMAPFEGDKVLAELEPKGVERLKAWRKTMQMPFSATEVFRLRTLSDRIDELWEQHLVHRRAVLDKMPRTLALWGQVAPTRAAVPQDSLTLAEYARELEDVNAPGRRLWRAMDYWCALWFWPLAAADELPSREGWLQDLEAMLGLAHERLEVDRDRSARVQELAGRLRFFHWQVAFVEVFANGGGMDVILGNPPWRTVDWQEAGVLADFDAALAVRKLNAKRWADRREQLLEDRDARAIYIREAEETAGTTTFLSATQNYPLLQGVRTNLYKWFISRTIQLGSQKADVGIIHQKGLYDDPRAGQLRGALAPRLRLRAQFTNEVKLFTEVDNHTQFEFSILRSEPQDAVDAIQIGNLFAPRTIDESLKDDGTRSVPGIKNQVDDWELRGHRSRLVPLNEQTLELFAQLYDAPGIPAREARLPVLHSEEILSVLRRYAAAPRRLADVAESYFTTQHFNETTQQKDGTIRRETRVPRNVNEWIVSGPHFFVGTPFNKTPNENCSHNKDYAAIDLTQISDDYLPRTNYVPACSVAEYRKRTPVWNGRPVTEFFRHVHREMVGPTAERTLIPALIAPVVAHVNTAFAIGSDDQALTVHLCALASSLPLDFFVKSTGMGHVNATLASRLPLVGEGAIRQALILRALRLNCLTTHYAPLWEELYSPDFTDDASTTTDPRAGDYHNLKKRWSRDVAFRTPFARRQALVELDALAALALGMTLDELQLIYRVQFPVLQQYERETFYDQRGKIVFTTNRGLSDVGLDRKQWAEISNTQAGERLPKWARDAQGAFEPPFAPRDREEDLAEAYQTFVKRLGKPKLKGPARAAANDAAKPGLKKSRPPQPRAAKRKVS
jgi:hypothetical protein